MSLCYRFGLEEQMVSEGGLVEMVRADVGQESLSFRSFIYFFCW